MLLLFVLSSAMTAMACMNLGLSQNGPRRMNARFVKDGKGCHTTNTNSKTSTTTDNPMFLYPVHYMKQ